jgi:hypothetical protein
MLGLSASGFGLPQIESESRKKQLPEKTLLLLPAFLGDVHNLVLEDEQIGRTFACQPDHVLVEILDPSMDGLAIHKFD